MLKHFYHAMDDNTPVTYGGTNWTAQSFTPGSTFTLSTLTLWYAKLGTPAGTLTVAIYATDVNGHKTGSPLGTTTVSYTTTSTTYPGIPLKATFNPGVVLTSGTQYVFTISLSAGNATNAIRITYKMVGAYTGGWMQTSTDSGATWADGAGDIHFDMYDADATGVKLYMSGGVKFGDANVFQIQRDASNSSILQGWRPDTGNVVSLIKSADYYYIATSLPRVYRYNADMTLDTTWASSGVFAPQGAVDSLAVDSSDFLAIVANLTKGRIYLLNASGDQQWLWTASATAWYCYGAAFDSSGNVVSSACPPSGSATVGGVFARANGTILLSFYTASVVGKTAVRTSDDEMFITGGGEVRDFDVLGGASVWNTTLSPFNWPTLSLAYVSSLDVLFLGSNRLLAGNLYKLNANTGAILATYDVGDDVNDVTFDLAGNLLVSSPQATDADAGLSSLREVDEDLAVLWRFTSDFVLTLKGACDSLLYPPEITSQTEGAGAPIGDPVSLFVVAIGNPAVTYQWYFDGGILVGEINSTIDFTSALDKEGSYTCIVTNTEGYATSDPIQFIVNGIVPTITAQSVSQSVVVGSFISLYVTATGLPTPTYQWYEDGDLLVGQTNSTYDFYAGTTATYTCIVTNAIGHADSAPIVISTFLDHPCTRRLFNIPSDLRRELRRE